VDIKRYDETKYGLMYVGKETNPHSSIEGARIEVARLRAEHGYRTEKWIFYEMPYVDDPAIEIRLKP
jgi:hypothetical protein